MKKAEAHLDSMLKARLTSAELAEEKLTKQLAQLQLATAPAWRFLGGEGERAVGETAS